MIGAIETYYLLVIVTFAIFTVRPSLYEKVIRQKLPLPYWIFAASSGSVVIVGLVMSILVNGSPLRHFIHPDFGNMGGIPYKVIEQSYGRDSAMLSVLVSTDLDSAEEILALGRQIEREATDYGDAIFYVFNDETAARLYKNGHKVLSDSEDKLVDRHLIGTYYKGFSSAQSEMWLYEKVDIDGMPVSDIRKVAL